jgi:HSP20 family protein
MYLVKRSYKPNSLFEDFFNLENTFGKEFLNNSIDTPVEVTSDEKNVYIKIELPGIDKKDIKIEYQDNTLSISGEKKVEKKETENKYSYSEINTGSFRRNINVGDINFEKGKADYINGVLSISLPKSAPQETKTLLIK